MTHPHEVKRPEHKADHPLRSSVEVKTRVAVHLPPLNAFTSIHLNNFITLYFFISICSSSSLKVCSNLQFIFPIVLSFPISVILLLPVFDPDSPVGAGTSLRAEYPWESGVNTGSGKHSFHHSIQSGPRIHRTSYSMGTESHFYWGRDDWSVKLTLASCSPGIKNAWNHPFTPHTLCGAVLY